MINDARKRKVTSGRVLLISLDFFADRPAGTVLRVEMPATGDAATGRAAGGLNAGHAVAGVLRRRLSECRGLAIHGSIAL